MRLAAAAQQQQATFLCCGELGAGSERRAARSSLGQLVTTARDFAASGARARETRDETLPIRRSQPRRHPCPACPACPRVTWAIAVWGLKTLSYQSPSLPNAPQTAFLPISPLGLPAVACSVHGGQSAPDPFPHPAHPGILGTTARHGATAPHAFLSMHPINTAADNSGP